MEGRREGQSKLRAFGGFLVVLAGFLALPLLVGEGVAAWRQIPIEVAQVHTVEFAAMPAPYRGRDRFVLQGGGTWPWRMQCARTGGAAPAQGGLAYRCELLRTVPRNLESEWPHPFPPAAGWRVQRDQIAVTEARPLSEAPQLWAEVLFALLAAGVYWRMRPSSAGPGWQPFARAEGGSPFARAAGWAALVLVADTMIAWVTGQWATASDVQLAAMFRAEAARDPVAMFLGAVLIGPAFEELVFRGIGWRVLQAAFPSWVVVALTTAAFTAVHPGLSPAMMLQVTGAGLGLAVVRMRTGSVAWCVVVHALMNAKALWL